MGDSTMASILTKEAQDFLTQQVMREKVTSALNQMHPFKIPSPN